MNAEKVCRKTDKTVSEVIGTVIVFGIFISSFTTFVVWYIPTMGNANTDAYDNSIGYYLGELSQQITSPHTTLGSVISQSIPLGITGAPPLVPSFSSELSYLNSSALFTAYMNYSVNINYKFTSSSPSSALFNKLVHKIDNVAVQPASINNQTLNQTSALYVPPNYIFFTEQSTNTTGVIDGSTNNVVMNVSVGSHPDSLIYNPLLKDVYVLDYASDNITVISTEGKIRTIGNIYVGSGPISGAYDNATGTILIANHVSDNITVISAANNTVIGTMDGIYSPTDVIYDYYSGTFLVSSNSTFVAIYSVDGLGHPVREYFSGGNYTDLKLYTTNNVANQPYQQYLILNLSTFGTNKNASNIEFTYAGGHMNGTVIPSWMQTWNKKSDIASYWLDILQPVNETGTYISVHTAPKDFNVLNGYNIGEAPDLSSVYGQYDDGATVFLSYFNGLANFSDFSVAGDFNISHTNVTYGHSVINALNVSGVNSTGAYLIYDHGISKANVVVQSSVDIANVTGSTGTAGLSDFSAVNKKTDSAVGVEAGGNNKSYFYLEEMNSNTFTTSGYKGAGSLNSGDWLNTTLVYNTSVTPEFFGFNSPNFISTAEYYKASNPYSGSLTYSPLSGSELYFALLTNSSGSDIQEYYNWMFIRATPSGGTMPSVGYNTTFTSVVGASPHFMTLDSSNSMVFASYSAFSGSGLGTDVPNVVAMFNTTSFQFEKLIGVGAGPEGLLYDSSNNLIYVPNYNNGNVNGGNMSVVNPVSMKVINNIAVGAGPFTGTFSPRTGNVYYVDVFSRDIAVISGGTVSLNGIENSVGTFRGGGVIELSTSSPFASYNNFVLADNSLISNSSTSGRMLAQSSLPVSFNFTDSEPTFNAILIDIIGSNTSISSNRASLLQMTVTQMSGTNYYVGETLFVSDSFGNVYPVEVTNVTLTSFTYTVDSHFASLLNGAYESAYDQAAVAENSSDWFVNGASGHHAILFSEKKNNAFTINLIQQISLNSVYIKYEGVTITSL